MADLGLISDAQVPRHPEHHRLTRALGSPGCVPDTYPVIMGEGYLLLCSDGLTEGLDDTGIRDICMQTEFTGICHRLVIEAGKRSRDNISVVVAKVMA
jgi:serine/threonine protein phosphatase PrpC